MHTRYTILIDHADAPGDYTAMGDPCPVALTDAAAATRAALALQRAADALGVPIRYTVAPLRAPECEPCTPEQIVRQWHIGDGPAPAMPAVPLLPAPARAEVRRAKAPPIKLTGSLYDKARLLNPEYKKILRPKEDLGVRIAVTSHYQAHKLRDSLVAPDGYIWVVDRVYDSVYVFLDRKTTQADLDRRMLLLREPWREYCDFRPDDKAPARGNPAALARLLAECGDTEAAAPDDSLPLARPSGYPDGTWHAIGNDGQIVRDNRPRGAMAPRFKTARDAAHFAMSKGSYREVRFSSAAA